MIVFLLSLTIAFAIRYLWCLTRPLMLLELWCFSQNLPHRLRLVAKGYLVWFPLLKPVTVGSSLLCTKAPYTAGERWAMIGLELLILGVVLLVLTPLEALRVPSRLYAGVCRSTYGFLCQWFENIASSAKITDWQEQAERQDCAYETSASDLLEPESEGCMENPVIPQTRVFLSDSSALCLIRDVTLDCPQSPWGQITILGQAVDVRFSSDRDGCFILADPYPESIEVFFREEPTEEDRERHPWHVQKNIYRGGCQFCDCEREAHEMDLLTRKVTHISYQEPIEGGIGDHASVRGLVEGATTQEDTVWVFECFHGDRACAKLAVANHPLACDAIWLHDHALQERISALPPARKPVSYVDFGDPRRDEWAR
jgi:hypothetical protein